MATKPGEHKTVQARILHDAQEIGWPYLPRAEAKRRRGFDPDGNPETSFSPATTSMTATGRLSKLACTLDIHSWARLLLL
jgi:hypothetical protein